MKSLEINNRTVDFILIAYRSVSPYDWPEDILSNAFGLSVWLIKYRLFIAEVFKV